MVTAAARRTSSGDQYEKDSIGRVAGHRQARSGAQGASLAISLLSFALSVGCGRVGFEPLSLDSSVREASDTDAAAEPPADADVSTKSDARVFEGGLQADASSTDAVVADASTQAPDASSTDAAVADASMQAPDASSTDAAASREACSASAQPFGPGSYTNIAIPAGCGSVTAELWGGGGGAGGKPPDLGTGKAGAGGSGGYAKQTIALAGGALNVLVGGGGKGCGTGGASPGSPAYSGGAGGSAGTAGSPGQDGMAPGGGIGGTTSVAGSGGSGYYGGGGGGGGESAALPPYSGSGGGGGAATVLILGATRSLVAGGGGGGGGAMGSPLFSTGGNGGQGCSGAGTVVDSGGGGGGGICVGTVTTKGGSGGPANPAALPLGQAVGATADCTNGGDGYAILTWGP